MKKNRFISKFENKSNSDLNEIISNRKIYTEQAIEAAFILLKQRENNIFSEETKPLKKDLLTNNNDSLKQPTKETYEFKTSFFYKMKFILFVTLIFYFFIESYNKNNDRGMLLFGSLTILGLYILYKIFKNKIQIKITSVGFWSEDSGFISWNEIETILIPKKTFLDYLNRYSREYIFLYLKKDSNTEPSYQIDIKGLSNKKTLREISQYYLKTEKTHDFEKETIILKSSSGNSTIYDTEKTILYWKENSNKIILFALGFSFIFPFIDKYIFNDNSPLIDKYGYFNSVIFIMILLAIIMIIFYFYFISKHKQINKKR
ncbi:hypothetical protein QVZ41_14165 [Wenyingzhuangia sp. chi5]|uniref:YcxB-like protein domain-containing protein n=1 Tax=Wenyingzhuangia gilva TaxID=3057677 RepID=A0ABT8VVJ5_9FLAO|nr:hypothetical protein [Wenyingzhuangia sp. chi5]MDO3695993.1 hypothetical protein [Wenyingzhuangia sp. chi5]